MTKELLKRTIKNLRAEYDRNHEYMDDNEAKQLLEDIESLAKMAVGARMYKVPDNGRIEFDEHYCPDHDKTFITESLYVGDDCKLEECIGWYWGPPTDENTMRYSFRKMIAIYDM